MCWFLLLLALMVWISCRSHEDKHLYLAQESEKVEKNLGKGKAGTDPDASLSQKAKSAHQ